MDPSSNVSVSFDPSEIEAILNKSAQQTSPLQAVVPQQEQPQAVPQQEAPSPFGALSTLANHALDYITPKLPSLDDISNKLQTLPEDITRFLTNPQAFTEAATGKNPLPQETGFAASFTGLPAKNPNSLFTPEGMAYQEGYETGEPYGIAAQVVPFLSPIAKPLAQEAATRAFMGESLLPKQLQPFASDTGALGIMEGRSSRNWSPQAENQFLNNEQIGMSPHANLAMTGMLRGPDGMLRQQISDKAAQVKLHESLIPRKDLTLEDVYDHPKLYDSYPWLKNIPVIFREDLPERSMGGYSPASNHIYLNAKHINNATEMKKTFGHEVSHIIQQAEGFGRGGNEAMFPVTQDIADAKELETYMNAANISAKDAADLFQATHKRRPSEVAVNYANSGQASMVPYLSPTKRYEHILGEIEARLSENRMGLTNEELRQYYPYEFKPQKFNSGLPEKKNFGLENDTDLEHALIHAGYDAKGKHIFMTAPEWRRSQAAREKLAARQVPTTDEMRAELALRPSEDMMSIKEKGGNWPETWVDTNLKRLKQNIPEFYTSKPFTQDQATYLRNYHPGIEDAYAMDFRQTGNHGMDYGKDFWPWMEKNFPNELNELVNKQTTGHALNNWVDNRLKPYLRNELATPNDSVRKLADEHGISHIKDLENTQPMSKFALEEARERNKMPLEGHATTPAGKMWENLADTSVHPMPAKEFIGDYFATATQNPGLIEAATRDPSAKIHQLGSDFDTRLGLDHLMDELRSSLTGNVPQHLALTPKTLERMTMADAVRHVSKINDYREKQMAKTAAKDMEHFPPIKAYANGDKWHEIKMPDVDHPLDEGHELIQFTNENGKPVHNIINKATGERMVDTTKHAKHAMEQYSEKKNYELLDKTLKNEGDMMGHCVGCYTDEVASGDTKIFTLRDKSNKPHATVEMNVVAPRWDELPDHVKGMQTPDLEDWIKDNPTVVLNQFKGKQNRPIIEKYRDQALDLLNNPENVHTIYSITDEGRRDLAGAGIIDRNDTKSVMNSLMSPSMDTKGSKMDLYNQLLEKTPDLPRFVTTDHLRELLQSNKPKGHKKGGKITKMNEGGISPASDIPQTPAKQNPNTTDYVKPKTVDPGFREIFERVRNTPKPTSGGGGGVGYVPGGSNPFNPDSPLNRKRGGRVNIDQMKLELGMRK